VGVNVIDGVGVNVIDGVGVNVIDGVHIGVVVCDGSGDVCGKSSPEVNISFISGRLWSIIFFLNSLVL